MTNERTPLLSDYVERRGTIEENVGLRCSSDNSEETSQTPLVTITQLFRFSDRTDSVLIIFALIGSIIHGIIIPVQFILFGKMVNDFIDYIIHEEYDVYDLPDLEAETTRTAGIYVALAVGNLVFSWLGMGLFSLSAERQVHKMRLAMFQSAIYQDIGWFETFSTGELNTRFTEEMKRISDGMGSKFSRIISSLVCFVGGYLVGFILCWDLTLILLAIFPLMMISGIFMTKMNGIYTNKELNAYAKAGKIAEQTISSIRTVAAFGGEHHQVKLYDENLVDVCKYAVRKAISFGVGMGTFQLVLYADYALSVWYIIKISRETDSTPGDALAIFFAVTMGSMILGHTAVTCFQPLTSARGAAFIVFEIIDQKSKIDASSNSGNKPESINGGVEFCNVNFTYPKRPAVGVLKDFNLKIPAGKCVALVGESGCGKSTIGKLLQRFYDPDGGSVLIDGRNVKEINVSHLRRYIGVVSQEPVLFSTTIAENIAFGCEGVTQYDIEEAAKIADAHDFILRFPKGYETLCGDRGAQMSGGQKQRIAIARALIRNPQILLLDEVTSALDHESEAVVQKAIHEGEEGRTTIIISHRLSTIRNADIIVLISEGRATEVGTHEELMALDGLYSSMVKLHANDEDDGDIEDDKKSSDEMQFFQVFDDGAHRLTTVVSTISESQGKSLLLGNEHIIKPVSFAKILKWNAPEWKFMVIGCLGAALYGAYPFLYGIAFGGVLHTMRYNSRIEKEDEAMEREAKKWAVFFFIIGVESGIGIFLQNWCFSSAGEALTKRLRKESFSSYLRQDMAFFDNPENGTGTICSRLATEVSSIQGATGPQLGLFISAVVTVCGGLVVSFSASWQITLAMISFTPIVIIAVVLINYFLGASDFNEAATHYAEVVQESFANIETIASFNRESECLARFCDAATTMHRKAMRKSHYTGFLAGSLMAIINLSFAVAFRLGGHLATEKEVTLRDMMKSIFTVILSAVVVGQVVSTTPDYTKAKRAASRLLNLLQRTPGIDSYSKNGGKLNRCRGELSFCHVTFRYPKRRNYKVLRNFNLTVQPGQTVALIGASGCGKTTLMSLIERFYDVNVGSVTIDGNDVRDLNLEWLRNQIAIVSQEPVLFNMTIRDNIAYANTTTNITDKEIIEAAKSANIHNFIMSLPKGYDTVVGDKGTLLSGGQKQRIAIARALVRNPKILLLDEVTSALDAESEKVVQEALEKAKRVGRTTLIIAHNLSTIQHADVIVVMKRGKMVEYGTHHQLLAMKGIYYTLYKAQSIAVGCSKKV